MESIIKNKNPKITLKIIISTLTDIKDEKLILVFSYLIKYHFTFMINNNLILIIKNLKNNHKKSWIWLARFYLIILKLFTNLSTIDNFNKNIRIKDVFENDNLKLTELTIKSFFDANFSQKNLLVKLKNIKNTLNLNIIIDQLKLCHNFLGHDFFKFYDIKTLTNKEFIKISDNEKIKYVLYILLSLNKILDKVKKSCKEFCELQQIIVQVYNI